MSRNIFVAICSSIKISARTIPRGDAISSPSARSRAISFLNGYDKPLTSMGFVLVFSIGPKIFSGPLRVTNDGFATASATKNPGAGLPETKMVTGTFFSITCSRFTVKFAGVILIIDIFL